VLPGSYLPGKQAIRAAMADAFAGPLKFCLVLKADAGLASMKQSYWGEKAKDQQEFRDAIDDIPL
jgi:hypothetical protein